MAFSIAWWRFRPWPDYPNGRDKQTLRTPDDRFANITDFPYAPRYAEVSDDGGVLCMAWVDHRADGRHLPREEDAGGALAGHIVEFLRR